MFDVRKHLLVELFAQAREGRHEFFRKGILGFQVCGHGRILLIAKPGVVVRENNAMQSRFGVGYGGDVGIWELALGHQV